ncbi:reverse transcriptase family protein [Ruminococcus flavefaciens]|uniref:reverse transcriptase family protein n=1 Tax=Ruminococcus flavefaciens TaxID=1265 RepID=UPI001FA7C773|nr:reverse transcriptase family protein [Ruminococcus flavefaciens]
MLSGIFLIRQQVAERTANLVKTALVVAQVDDQILHLYQLEVSDFSTAYCKGKSLLDNVSPHIGKECVLKIDISHFFDSINDDMVYLVMKCLGLSIPATTLLTHLCTYKARLPQGAPNSSYIANLVMKQFDEKLGHLCCAHNITYTRYCDDMTFSGNKADIRSANVVGKVRRMLYRMGFKLNDKKTVFIS